ncbi:MAG TPA: DbpA RNA binding domain-containing protein [Gemmatimonadales bacterium]
MSDLEAVHLAPPVAQLLAAAGWPAGHPAMREAAPVAARGNNLVFAAPPSPAWARPVLGGVISRLLASRRGPVLALCPEAAIDEWARVAGQTAEGCGVRLAAAHTPARVTRLLGTGALDLVFLAPETAHELVRRSVLKMDAVDGILLLTPEQWGGDESVAELLQDAPREVQRIVVTADPAGMSGLIERYCWRAPVVDLLAPAPAGAPPDIRATTVGWRRRPEALADLLEQLDPETISVWVADLGDRTMIASALEAAGTTGTITTAAPGNGGLIVAWDLPSEPILRELAAAGSVVLLVPPGAGGYVEGLAARRRPILLGGSITRTLQGVAAARRKVAERLDQGIAPAAAFAVAPLLERHDAGAVAAALYDLWQGAESRAPAPAQPASAAPPAGKVWVGIGKKDGVTPHDLVAALVKDAGVPREAVGKVEIRETFSLVELKAGADPAQAAERLAGQSIRKRRLVARVDRR